MPPAIAVVTSNKLIILSAVSILHLFLIERLVAFLAHLSVSPQTDLSHPLREIVIGFYCRCGMLLVKGTGALRALDNATCGMVIP